MKRVISMVLALMLVLGLATTAFAATVENRTDHAYDVYQIFTGTQEPGKTQLGDVQWGNGIDHENLLPAMKAANSEIYGNCETAKDVAVALSGDGSANGKKGDAEKFANFIVDYVTTPIARIEANDSTVDLPNGYYLLVDVTDVDGETDAKNPALLQVTNNGNVTIAKKYDVPIHEKKINVGGTTGEADVAEYSVGDVVEFVLRATLPMNITDYEKYALVFHDSMSEGLEFQKDSVEVYVSGGTRAAEEKVSTDHYDVVFPVTDCDCDTSEKPCTFEVQFEDANEFAQNNSVITIRYKAILTDKALIDNANPNSSALEFSNDPNWVPSDEQPDSPTGITPWDEVEVYTTEVEITKRSGANNAILTGAAFQITGESANIVITSGDVFVPYEDATNAAAKYWLLTDGTYTTTAPDTVNPDPLYVQPLAEYMMVSKASLDTTGEGAVEAKAFVNSNGKVSFSGLGVGTYTIKEIVTPGGYNTIGDITLVIGFDTANKTFTYVWSGGATGAYADVTVLNYQGSTLPETGGIGTTIFYIIGGLMVAASAVLLVTKKRMSAE